MNKKVVGKTILFVVLFVFIIALGGVAGYYIYNSLIELVFLVTNGIPVGINIIRYKLDIATLACVIALMFFVLVLTLFLLIAFIVSAIDNINYYKKNKE